jgi:hypothetical protein
MTEIEEYKIRQKAFRDVEDALRNELIENGPLVLWLGDGKFPGGAKLRGLSVPLCEWLGLRQ